MPGAETMVTPLATAICLAALTCATVSGLADWTSQPSSVIRCCPIACTAFMVNTVLGASTPVGRPLTCWILGPAMHSPAGQFEPLGDPLPLK